MGPGAFSKSLVSGRLRLRKPDRRKFDRISNPRTAVFIGLLALLTLLFARSAGARAAPGFAITAIPAAMTADGSLGRVGKTRLRRAEQPPGMAATDSRNARGATLADGPFIPEAGVETLHTRRVVVDENPDAGSGEPATRASRHRPAATAGRCFSVALPLESAVA